MDKKVLLLLDDPIALAGKIPKELIKKTDDTIKAVSFAGKPAEEIRSIYKATNKRRNRASVRLANKIHGGFRQ